MNYLRKRMRGLFDLHKTSRTTKESVARLHGNALLLNHRKIKRFASIQSVIIEHR
jgi:hypothetical protein